jgi:hypothetical protein
MQVRIAVVLMLLAIAPAALAASPENAVAPSPEQIQAWRAEGPVAVDRLMAKRDRLIAAAEKVPGKESYTLADRFVVQNNAERAAWKRVQAISETIDAVAGAKYSHVSGLYWYTDEAEARRVAQEQGKPILALRLLGNLDEELSCANSRYFRILLYPDESIRRLLHDKFVLTWTSVRSVPTITIDLGDGRKVVRTITGNSVHYVALPDGQVVDCFPGLYGPKPFFERLQCAVRAAHQAINSCDSAAVVADYRQVQLEKIEHDWWNDVVKYEAACREESKSSPSLDVGLPPLPPASFWQTIGDLHPEYAEFGKATQELVKYEAVVGYYANVSSRPEDKIATRYGDRVVPAQAWVKGGDEAIMAMLFRCVIPAIKSDTVYNEYCGRHFALSRLDRRPKTLVNALNWVVYDEIFGYPPDDPWAGLSQLDSLTGLPEDRGLIDERQNADEHGESAR